MRPVIDQPICRGLVVVLLVGALFSLPIWFGAAVPAGTSAAYPTGGHLVGDYDRFVGQRVVVTGRVITVDPVVVRTVGEGSSLRLEVSGPTDGATVDDQLQVYGVVEPGMVIRSIDAIAVPRIGLWYTWSVSFLSGLWVLARFVRDWDVAPAFVKITPREGENGWSDADA